MADIIQIRERLSRNSRRPLTDTITPMQGSILMFTGIRYERLGDISEVKTTDDLQQNTNRTH